MRWIVVVVLVLALIGAAAAVTSEPVPQSPSCDPSCGIATGGLVAAVAWSAAVLVTAGTVLRGLVRRRR